MPSEGVPVILAGSEGGHVLEEAAEKSGVKIALLKEFQISDEEYRWAHFLSLDKVLSQLGVRNGAKVAIGSSAQFIPYDHVLMFQSKFGADSVVQDPELLQLIKYEKSETELAIMQQANVIADAALGGMLAVTVPGMRELQVAGVGDYIMKELGAGRSGFPTIVDAGDRGYTIIGPATNNVIREGDMVSLGVSPTFNGYHGLVRRTVRAGKAPTPKQGKFLEAVEGLYHTVMEATKEAAEKSLPSNYIDQLRKAYLERVRLKTLKGDLVTPHEPTPSSTTRDVPSAKRATEPLRHTRKIPRARGRP
ncbi:MAG: M24 family metallopeptidase [Candidatus Bathyarchaeia archaeon]